MDAQGQGDPGELVTIKDKYMVLWQQTFFINRKVSMGLDFVPDVKILEGMLMHFLERDKDYMARRAAKVATYEKKLQDLNNIFNRKLDSIDMTVFEDARTISRSEYERNKRAYLEEMWVNVYFDLMRFINSKGWWIEPDGVPSFSEDDSTEVVEQ